MQADIVRRLHVALPDVQRWIHDYVNRHSGVARPVSTLGFPRLPQYFPEDLLARTKVVTVPRVQFPPVHKYGLPELAPIQHVQFAGITLGDTMFLQQGHASESLHFHEMVHVVQWARLGVENFLLAYGVGLVRHGYEASPLERMAYSLQAVFEDGSVRRDLVPLIEQETDVIWSQVAPHLRAGGRP